MINCIYSTHTSGFKNRLSKTLLDFPKHRKKIMQLPFTQLPWQDVSAIERINLPSDFRTIVIVGMGGASLGAKAICGLAARSPQTISRKIVFLDNVDPVFVQNTLNSLDLKKTFFLIISKSGETIEILALFSLIFSKIRSMVAPTLATLGRGVNGLASLRLGLRKNFLILTDNRTSSLGKLAKKHSLALLTSPHNIPGRFSVLSIIGLLPAHLAGIQITKLLSGAAQTKWEEAYRLACYQYHHFQNGKNISVLFPYSEYLSDFADWYIQLLSESIGKSKRIGITPVKAIGVKDQHSQLQLFLDGPDDKFYILIRIGEREKIKIVEKKLGLEKLFHAEYEGVKKAFAQRKKPFCELNASAQHESFHQSNITSTKSRKISALLSPATLGELFFFFEQEIAFLGSLFNINTQNQPAVELSKKLTKIVLNK